MIKTKHKLALIFLFILAVGSCVAIYMLYNALFNSILEPSDVAFLKVEEVPGVHPTRIRIYGTTLSSAISVKKITTKTGGSVLVVLVYGSLPKEGTSGTFQYELSVPDAVDEVKFGRSSTLIWKRGTNSPQMPIWNFTGRPRALTTDGWPLTTDH